MRSKSKMSSVVSRTDQENCCRGLVWVDISLNELASSTAGGQVFRELVNQFLTALLFGNEPVGIYADAINKMVNALNMGVTVLLSLTGVKRKTGTEKRGEGVLNGKKPNAAGRLFDGLPFVLTNTVTGPYDLRVIFKFLPKGFLTYQDYVASLYTTGKVTLNAGGVSLGHYMQAFEPLVRFLLTKGRAVKLTGVVHSSIMGGVERAPNTLFTMWLYYNLKKQWRLYMSYDLSSDTVSVSLTGGETLPKKLLVRVFNPRQENVEAKLIFPLPLDETQFGECWLETCARYYIGSGKEFRLKGEPSTGHFALLVKMFPDNIKFVQGEGGYIISFPKKNERAAAKAEANAAAGN